VPSIPRLLVLLQLAAFRLIWGIFRRGSDPQKSADHYSGRGKGADEEQDDSEDGPRGPHLGRLGNS